MNKNSRCSQIKHNYGLDIFRIFAALAAFVFHANQRGLYLGALQWYSFEGATSMTAFFILSGFSLYLGYEDIDIANAGSVFAFYKKRLVSIFPLYLVIFILSLIFEPTKSIMDTLVALPLELLLIQSYSSGTLGIANNGLTWFVSCIMFCYLLFPFFSNLIKQLPKKERLFTLFTLVLVILYYPIVVGYYDLSSIITLYPNPIFRFGEFAVGILLCTFIKNEEIPASIKQVLFNPLSYYIEMIFMMIIVSICISKNLYVGNHVLYSWICLPIFVLMIISAYGMNIRTNILRIILKYLGELTYSFYLSQCFSWTISNRIGTIFCLANKPYLFTFISFLICLILAIAFHEIIEKNIKNIYKKVVAQ